MTTADIIIFSALVIVTGIIGIKLYRLDKDIKIITNYMTDLKNKTTGDYESCPLLIHVCAAAWNESGRDFVSWIEHAKVHHPSFNVSSN